MDRSPRPQRHTDRTGTGPGSDRDRGWTGTELGLDRGWTGAGPGLDRDWTGDRTRIRPGLDQYRPGQNRWLDIGRSHRCHFRLPPSRHQHLHRLTIAGPLLPRPSSTHTAVAVALPPRCRGMSHPCRISRSNGFNRSATNP